MVGQLWNDGWKELSTRIPETHPQRSLPYCHTIYGHQSQRSGVNQINLLEINEKYDLNHTYTLQSSNDYQNKLEEFIGESLIPFGEGFAITAMISYILVHLSMNL